MRKAKAGLIVIILLIGFATTLSFNNHINAQPARFFQGDFEFGPILGTVMDKNGKLDWILTGEWRSSLLNDNASANNESQVFNAAIDMLRPNGTERHTHTITEFRVLNASQSNSNGTVYSGTSVISLKNGPVLDVPTTIKAFNSTVLSIFMDPTKVGHHFGEGEIYGIVAPQQQQQHYQSQSGHQNNKR
jgi:hypothetical protein